MIIKFKRLVPEAIMPSRGDSASSGWDLALPGIASSNFILKPDARVLAKLGFSMEIVRPKQRVPNPELALEVICNSASTMQSLEQWYKDCTVEVDAPVFCDGFWLAILPRSGNALKKGLTVLNSPGNVDESYRGEIGVILINTSDAPIEFHPGDKVAQAVLMPFYTQEWIEAEELSASERGEKGFGSSGVVG